MKFVFPGQLSVVILFTLTVFQIAAAEESGQSLASKTSDPKASLIDQHSNNAGDVRWPD